MQTVFDIGMYNGLDTAYYLESGYRVIAVEANPVYVARARQRFEREIDGGRLVLVAAAIADHPGPLTLHVSGDDAGSSSVLADWVAPINPVGSYTVEGIRYADLVRDHGAPHFVKVDIEGADRYCVLALERRTAPAFLSFEIGQDFEELIDHVIAIGFRRFKIISQVGFRSIVNDRPLYDRGALLIMRILGYEHPMTVRRAGRFFRSQSSGPVPWQSDGRWEEAAAIRARWRDFVAAGRAVDWYDLQASRLD